MQPSVFQTLADPSRLQIVEALLGGECAVNDLVAQVHIHQSGVSRHLRILEEAGLLQRVRSGKHHRFHLNLEPLAAVRSSLDELTKFWLQRLDGLERFLETEKSKAKPKDS